MKKKMFAVACGMFFLIACASSGLAATLKCEVVSSEEGDDGVYTVTMSCDDKDAKDLKEGQKLKVRVKKGAAIEGC